MAKRPKYSRWRRLPGLYRTGEEKAPDPNEEVSRLSHYVPWKVIDEADAQSIRYGYASVQDYCTDLLTRAVESERLRDQVAGVEARRGPLRGFRAVSEDPEFLAELGAAAVARSRTPPDPSADDSRQEDMEVRFLEPEPSLPGAGLFAAPEPLRVDLGNAADRPRNPAPPLVLEGLRPEVTEPSAAARVVLRHAGQLGDSDSSAFLPALRRGHSVPPSVVAELAKALQQLEDEYRGSRSLDRGLSFALHRLAFESQVLHTDAWPGTFDVWTVDLLRAVQEAVERILSGQDIRYYPDAAGPTTPTPPRPEPPR